MVLGRMVSRLTEIVPGTSWSRPQPALKRGKFARITSASHRNVIRHLELTLAGRWGVGHLFPRCQERGRDRCFSLWESSHKLVGVGASRQEQPS